MQNQYATEKLLVSSETNKLIAVYSPDSTSLAGVEKTCDHNIRNSLNWQTGNVLHNCRTETVYLTGLKKMMDSNSVIDVAKEQLAN